MDYPVPNFGIDRDILDNSQSLAAAEKIRKHTWKFEFCEKGKPCDPSKWTKYNMEPEVSDDVKETQASLSLAEEQIGHELTVADVAFVDDKYTYASA